MQRAQHLRVGLGSCGPIRDTLRAFISVLDTVSGEKTKSDETWRKNFGFKGDVDLAA